MAYREVYGQWKHFYNDVPLTAGQIVKIELEKNDYDSDANYLKESYSVVLITNGFLPNDFKVWCNSDGSTGSTYKVTDPDNETWKFSIAYGDGSPVSIAELRAGGSEPSNTDTVLSLIEDNIAAKAVRYDIIQTLTTPEKNRVKTALDITSGGDMTKAVYDTDNDGVVDEAEVAFEADFAEEADHALDSDKLGNVAANLYALKSYVDSADANKADRIPTIETETGTSYTLLLADLGKIKKFTNNSAITLTIPSGLGAGFNCAVIQRGNGQITFAAGSGATISNPLAHTKSVKNGVVTIVADSANELIYQGATE